MVVNSYQNAPEFDSERFGRLQILATVSILQVARVYIFYINICNCILYAFCLQTCEVERLKLEVTTNYKYVLRIHDMLIVLKRVI